MKKRILTFGNPVYDVIMTPVLTRRERVLSGCSTNACLAVSYLGEQGILVGTVGLIIVPPSPQTWTGIHFTCFR